MDIRKMLEVLVATALLAAPLRAADPFYLDLLRQGTHAFDRRDYTAAAHDLRLACFGLLDEPELLVDGMVRLAVAQARTGDEEGFRQSFRRIVEVEERFGAYGRVSLPREVTAAFEEQLLASVPAATLAAVPVFKPLVARQIEAQLARLSPREQRRELEKRRAAEPGNPLWPALLAKLDVAEGRSAPPASPPPAAVDAQPSRPATAPSGPATQQAASPPLSADAREKMARARALLAGEGTARELRQALDLARGVADAHPGSKEAQHLAAEAAYRNSRWQESLDFFRRGGEPSDQQPELLFYEAVALYESGDRQTAAGVLQRALPGLRRTPFVESYSRRILGSTER